jgi:hypothetical protein
MSYLIGTYGFTKWDGPPPQLVKQHIQRFTKLGQAGISALALGIHGDPFQVTLDAKFSSQANAMVAEAGYRTLIAAAPQVVTFNGVNYSTAHSHTYLVESVETVSFKRHPRLIGPGINYLHGWILKSRWQLIPIA